MGLEWGKGVFEREEDMQPPNMPLWHKDYCEQLEMLEELWKEGRSYPSVSSTGRSSSLWSAGSGQAGGTGQAQN